MTDTREFMRELCGSTVMTIQPFRFEQDGESWDVATNGHGLLFMRGATFEARENAPPVGPFLRAPERIVGECHLAPLVAWAQESVSEFSHPAGFSEIVPASQEIRCAELFGRAFDRYNVWRFLRHLPFRDSLRVHAADDPMSPYHLLSEDWVAVLMPLRPEHGLWLGEPFPRPV